MLLISFRHAIISPLVLLCLITRFIIICFKYIFIYHMMCLSLFEPGFFCRRRLHSWRHTDYYFFIRLWYAYFCSCRDLYLPLLLLLSSYVIIYFSHFFIFARQSMACWYFPYISRLRYSFIRFCFLFKIFYYLRFVYARCWAILL